MHSGPWSAGPMLSGLGQGGSILVEGAGGEPLTSRWPGSTAEEARRRGQGRDVPKAMHCDPNPGPHPNHKFRDELISE